jgi:hypothetical protein
MFKAAFAVGYVYYFSKSMLTSNTFSGLFEYVACSFSKYGDSATQGAHQVAQKLIT